MSPPPDVDRLSHADLKDLVLRLLEEVVELQRTVAAQRDEIARLKGGSGRPNIKPSGMDSATEPKQSLAGGEPRQKGSKTSKLSIHEERTVELEAPPQGARFKGYTDYVVQDLMIRPHVVNFRCERWQTAGGAMMTAPLPAGISGHFGPQLRRFVLVQYHQAQVTVPRLLALLRAFGIIISKRQIVRLLIGDQDRFLDEGCATPDNVQFSGARRCGRSDVLRIKPAGLIPARRRICRQNPAPGEARRHPDRATDQIRSCRQPNHRPGARPHGAAEHHRPRQPHR